MNVQQREIQRRLRVIKHAEKLGNVQRTCHYFGIARSTFFIKPLSTKCFSGTE